MSNLDLLMRVSPSSQLLILETDAKSAGQTALEWRQAGLTVRTVRGNKMRTYDGLMDEFAAALQFPYYFGENWPAFNECLSDMDWLPKEVGIVVVIRGAVEVLSGEPTSELGVLVRAFEHARRTYSETIAQGEPWDRPAVPFHIVLQTEVGDSAKLASRWTDSGAELSRLRADDGI